MTGNEGQGSFFGEDESEARKKATFRTRIEKAFGRPMEEVDPAEALEFVHQVDEDEARLELEQKEKPKDISLQTAKEINRIIKEVEDAN